VRLRPRRVALDHRVRPLRHPLQIGPHFLRTVAHFPVHPGDDHLVIQVGNKASMSFFLTASSTAFFRARSSSWTGSSGGAFPSLVFPSSACPSVNRSATATSTSSALAFMTTSQGQ